MLRISLSLVYEISDGTNPSAAVKFSSIYIWFILKSELLELNSSFWMASLKYGKMNYSSLAEAIFSSVSSGIVSCFESWFLCYQHAYAKLFKMCAIYKSSVGWDNTFLYIVLANLNSEFSR